MIRLTILSMILVVGLMTAQTSDSTKRKAVAPVETVEGVRLQNQTERLTVLGVALVLFGGLGMILNEKRRRADRKSGFNS